MLSFISLVWQECTENIVTLLRTQPWWDQYATSPIPEDKPYFTVLAVQTSCKAIKVNSPFREAFFPNTVMDRRYFQCYRLQFNPCNYYTYSYTSAWPELQLVFGRL